ncbi:MAG: hypothetical protein U9Q29_08215 [Campylobacterota bacterium]|nr:hypothetical protein [Campylobacterota bacterium]
MNLEQFLQLFNPLPGNHYLQVTRQKDEITDALNFMLEKVDGELDVVLYNDENLNFSQPFRALARSNDIVVFKDIFAAHKNQKMILKIAYTSLANTADIIIMEKKGLMDVEQVKEMLEEFEFRAANEIDIVDGYDLVMAKKMHMWGNGL